MSMDMDMSRNFSNGGGGEPKKASHNEKTGPHREKKGLHMMKGAPIKRKKAPTCIFLYSRGGGGQRSPTLAPPPVRVHAMSPWQRL